MTAITTSYGPRWVAVDPSFLPSRRYRGKRARRAAFYNASRMARIVTRLVRGSIDTTAWDLAFQSCVETGVGWMVHPDGRAVFNALEVRA